MSRIQWDQDTKRLYETGTSNGVLYKKGKNGTYTGGVPWNGLTGVSENPSGADATPLYANNAKYLNLRSVEEYGGSIKAYTYPEEFNECDGSVEIAPGVYAGQQSRVPFGLAYKTIIGNDAEGESYGYKLHLIYGAEASPSQKDYQTINDNPDAIEFSWDFDTTPVSCAGLKKPTASLVIDSNKVPSASLTALEDILYGTDEAEPRLPLPDEVARIFKGTATPTTPSTNP